MAKIARSAPDQLLHPRDRLVEGGAVALLDLGAHLRAEAQREAPLREQLHVVGLMGELNGVAWERDCHVGHQVQTPDGRRDRQRREHVVRSLEREYPGGTRFAQCVRAFDRIRRTEQRCHDLHSVRA